MADRFGLLPYELQHYIHSLALNTILIDRYFIPINRMRAAISLLLEIGAPFEDKPAYSISFPARPTDGYDSIFDFNNDHVLSVLSYAAKVFNPNYEKYCDVDNGWWFSLVTRCYSDIETTYEVFNPLDFPLLTSAQYMTNCLFYKLNNWRGAWMALFPTAD